MEIKNWLKNYRKRDVTVYLVLRALVILTIIVQAFRGNWENVFLGILTFVLFLIPSFIEHRLKIKLPDTLEIIILLFIFSAEILGEIQNFYGIFRQWDTILHTINGFLCAAIGFSLIDILNNTDDFYIKMTPAFVALVAFSFSMTIGILWEFFEYSADKYFATDMQKDRMVEQISSTKINPNGENEAIVIDNISKVKIYSNDNQTVNIIEGGYLDIGLIDTMKDLFVNFIGALVFSIIGYLYILNRDGYKFAEVFIPRLKKKNTLQKES